MEFRQDLHSFIHHPLQCFWPMLSWRWSHNPHQHKINYRLFSAHTENDQHTCQIFFYFSQVTNKQTERDENITFTFGGGGIKVEVDGTPSQIPTRFPPQAKFKDGKSFSWEWPRSNLELKKLCFDPCDLKSPPPPAWTGGQTQKVRHIFHTSPNVYLVSKISFQNV